MENSLLATDIRFQGRLNFEGDAIIDGNVQGQIESNGKLVIDKSGRVEADIVVRSLTVYGKFLGSIVATEEVELMKDGLVQGDIVSPLLTIHRGAKFIGNSSMPKENEPQSKK